MFKRKKILYRDLVWEWLKIRRSFLKESTYANYCGIVYNHIIPDIGDYYLSEISNRLLQEFINKKYQNGRVDGQGGLSCKTIRDIISILKLSIKYAIKNKMMEMIDLDFYYPNDCLKNKLKVLSKGEQRKLISYLLQKNYEKDMGILLSLYTGIRIGELCALKWGDINFNKNYIVINKTIQRIYIKNKKVSKLILTPPKTKNSMRIVPVNPEFIEKLKEFKKNDGYYVLTSTNSPLEPVSLRKYYYRVLRKAGINRVSFHTLRHTFASNCIRLGCDYKTVSELLGHASVNITLNIYVHSQLNQKKKCVNTVYKDLIGVCDDDE